MRTGVSRKIAGFLLPVLLLLSSAVFFSLTIHNLQMLSVGSMDMNHAVLIIDPGHGGIDGGAIALNGAKESDINLSIAIKLRNIASFMGLANTMTREDDRPRTDIQSYSEHEDLVHRTDTINSIPGGVLISIHQNCYPTSQPTGAQVLYAKGEGSRRLGELTHQNILQFLQPENRRVSEPAPKRLYITSHVSCPAILVECGFLSYYSDVENLTNDHYQTSLAVVLMVSYLQFLSPNRQG